MERPEKFSFVAGILGFVVDVVTLVTFIGAGVDEGGVSLSLQLWAILTMIYGWFITSWVLLRRNYQRYESLPDYKRPQEPWMGTHVMVARRWSLGKKVPRAVASVGCALLPVTLLLGYPWVRQGIPNPGNVFVAHIGLLSLAGIVAQALLGVLISIPIYWLMPVIYEEMENCI